MVDVLEIDLTIRMSYFPDSNVCFFEPCSLVIAIYFIDLIWKLRVKFIVEEADCSPCQEAEDVPIVKNVTNFVDDYVSMGNPVIVTDVKPYMHKNITIESFYDYYLAHKEDFNKDLCEVSYVDETVDTNEHYFDLLEKSGLETPNIRWSVSFFTVKTIR